MARLHEHQGKALLGEAGVRIPRGILVRSPQEAEQALLDLGGRAIMKIQALVEDLGAAGGVEMVSSPQTAVATARRMLALGTHGIPVSELLVEVPVNVVDELHLSITAGLDGVRTLRLAASRKLPDTPASVDSVRFGPPGATPPIDLEAVAGIVRSTGLDPDFHGPLVEAVTRIASLAEARGATDLEVDPLVTTVEGSVVAIDCRITLQESLAARPSGRTAER
ncbi:MAG: ATP-grasp domain-containing protein [Planctomycetota bacterium]|nr:ATP-grasp domain-containing protein [Planctomycetota bacterium]